MGHLRLLAMVALMIGAVAGSGLVCMPGISDSRDAANRKFALHFEGTKFCDELSSAMDTLCQHFSRQICEAARKKHNEQCTDSWKLASDSYSPDSQSSSLGEIITNGGEDSYGGNNNWRKLLCLAFPVSPSEVNGTLQFSDCSTNKSSSTSVNGSKWQCYDPAIQWVASICNPENDQHCPAQKNGQGCAICPVGWIGHDVSPEGGEEVTCHRLSNGGTKCSPNWNERLNYPHLPTSCTSYGDTRTHANFGGSGNHYSIEFELQCFFHKRATCVPKEQQSVCASSKNVILIGMQIKYIRDRQQNKVFFQDEKLPVVSYENLLEYGSLSQIPDSHFNSTMTQRFGINHELFAAFQKTWERAKRIDQGPGLCSGVAQIK